MGRYFEEFYRYDLPRHFIDSRNRRHTFDLNGHHSDDCLEADIGARLLEISGWQKISTKGLKFSVRDGTAYLVGDLPKDEINYIVSAIDSLEGIMSVQLSSETVRPVTDLSS